MAGIVIIDNASNTVKQIGETAASWVLRGGAYLAANARNVAEFNAAKPEKTYPLNHNISSNLQYWHTLKMEHSKSKYDNMRFLQDDIPVNNLILKNKNNFFIEFVNAKIRVFKQNTIVETALVNRAGTIKEYITAKDYEIDISGDIMTDAANVYPSTEMGVINGFLDIPEEFEVTNAYLSEFGIHKMVFKSGNFNQQGQKFFNVLPFDFQFISDNDSDNAYGLIMENQ